MNFKSEYALLIKDIGFFCKKELDEACIDALLKNGMFFYNSEEHIALLAFLEELRNYTETIDDRGRFLILGRISDCEKFIKMEV